MTTKQSTQATSGEGSRSTTVSLPEESRCPECGQESLDREGKEQFCQACGLVLGVDSLERSIPTWADPDDRHVGPGESNQWLGRGTCIGTGSAEGGPRSARLRKYNERLDSEEQTLYRGLRELRAICEELEVGEELRERAGHLYRRAVDEGLLQGRTLEGFAGASVFVALRERDFPVTLVWLADVSFAVRDELAGAYRVFLSSFDLRILPPVPADFLSRVASELGVAPRFERIAHQILEQADKVGISQGKHPAGFAGAALYAAVRTEGQTVKQEEIAKAAGVSLVTISRRWRSIDDELELEELSN